MRENRVVKAYTAAWKWPEVYTTSPSLIWTSRAIAVLVPVSLVVVTFLTALPIFGLGTSALFSAFLILIIMVVTVQLFYQEFVTVEDFQSRERRIKEFFHGFPSITDVPLIEHEKGEWIAYGHLDPVEFLDAIEEVILEVTGDMEGYGPYIDLENSVGHLYATFQNPEEGHWGEGINFCKSTAENCFPITRISL